jgi:plastocyanin
VCTLALMVMAGSGTAQPPPTSWKVAIGGESPDHAIQVQDFFPRTITINAGDTITWTKTTLLPHTVHFLAGAKSPDLIIPQKDGKLLFNPVVINPQGGKTYDGTGVAASGFLPEQKGLRYTLTFTKPGTYTYVCAIHPGMTGTVVVQPAGTRIPETQAQFDTASAKQLAQELEQGKRLLAAAKLSTRKTEKGTVYISSLAGSRDAHISFMRFSPETITVRVGDTVQWDMRDAYEIHTVTFPGPAMPPEFIIPEPQSQGPPKIYFNPKAMIPVAGPHKGNAFYNSGVLTPPPAPVGPHTFSVTFTKAGTYTYWCVVHIPEGMKGTVIVQ